MICRYEHASRNNSHIISFTNKFQPWEGLILGCKLLCLLTHLCIATMLALLLLLLLSCFSRVRLCAIPEMAAHQAPPSLGFFRKITEVGYHFLLQCMKVKSQSEVTQSCLTQGPHGLQPNRLLCPWDFPGKNKVLHIKESWFPLEIKEILSSDW